MSTRDSVTPSEPRPERLSGGGATSDAAVIAALVLGWRLAELYDQDSLPPPSRESAAQNPPAHLPGASEASDHDRAVVLLDQADDALRRLATVLGSGAPTLADLRAVLGRDPHDREEVRTAILKVHSEAQSALIAADPRLGTSYGLGRLLADTVWLPRSKQPDTYRERFDPFRLSNADAWLDDLGWAFPHRAAAAVRAGLHAWQTRISNLLEGDARDDGFDEWLLRRLRAQGECWRRLLAGEKDPLSLLGPTDYVDAADGLLRRGRAIALHFLSDWWIGITAVLVVTGAGVWAAVSYAPAGTDRVVAVLVSVTAALGVSWKGVGASLGRTLARAEAALWAAEVDEAIGRAATLLPKTPRRRSDVP